MRSSARSNKSSLEEKYENIIKGERGRGEREGEEKGERGEGCGNGSNERGGRGSGGRK